MDSSNRAPEHGAQSTKGIEDMRGFDNIAKRIARRRNPRTGKPYGEEKARAILASAARKASAKAKAENPNLEKVSGAS